MEKPPEYKSRQKSLLITFKDTLQKNTTYVINFGKAIASLTEGVVLKNFTYVFSTGTHIDSLSIAGNVINTLTQQKEKDVTVMLFTLHQDSLLFGKKKPSVYTTTDTAGNFSISNLHEGLYKLYALKETTADKIYNNDNELIGIPTKTINLQNDTTGIQLKLFKQIPAKFRLERKVDPDGKISLVFNKPLEKPGIRILYPTAQNEDKYVQISKTRDTALLYVRNMDFDSLSVAVYDNNKPVDTTAIHKGRKETYVRQITAATTADTRQLLKPGTDLGITFNMPIIAYDPSLIVLKGDSTLLSDYTIDKDTSNLKHLTLKYKWRQNVSYNLTFNAGAVTGYFGDKNKQPIVKKFKIDKPENYSLLTLKVTVPDTAKAYIVEFFNEQNSLLRSDVIRKNTSLVYRNYITGKYHVRVIYDDNKNGIWDTGSIKNNRQPENVWVDKDIIALRPNFDSETTILIPREPIL